MSTTIITGAFTIIGVLLGATLEWSRAAMATRRHQRASQDQALTGVTRACTRLAGAVRRWREEEISGTKLGRTLHTASRQRAQREVDDAKGAAGLAVLSVPRLDRKRKRRRYDDAQTMLMIDIGVLADSGLEPETAWRRHQGNLFTSMREFRTAAQGKPGKPGEMMNASRYTRWPTLETPNRQHGAPGPEQVVRSELRTAAEKKVRPECHSCAPRGRSGCSPQAR